MGCFDPMLAPALSRCSPVCLGGARGKELLQNREGLVGDRLFGERVGNGTLGGVLRLGGGSAGQGLHSQGSYGRWGFALPRLGNLLLRSNARSGPVPLLLGCRDVGGA